MSFIEARLTNQSVPRARELPVADGEAFEVGALLQLVDGELEEVDANPVGTVEYVAQSPFGAAGEDDRPTFRQRLEFPPGKTVVTDAYVTTFRAEFEGTRPTDAGGSYGVVRGADGRWRVNFANTTNLVVRYLGPVSNLPGLVVREVEVEFLPA